MRTAPDNTSLPQRRGDARGAASSNSASAGAPLGSLLRQVAAVQRRLMLRQALAALPWCAAAAFALAAAIIAWGKFFTPWAAWSTLLGAATGLTLVLTAGWSRLTQPTTLATAVELDRRCGLQERVSSALAVAGGMTAETKSVETVAAEAVRIDAERRLAAVDTAAAFPLAVPRRNFWPLIPAALALACSLWLAPRSATTSEAAPAAAVPAANVREHAAALEKKLEEKKQQAERLKLAEAMRLLEQLREESRQLQSGKPLDQKDALVKLSDMANELAERRKEVETAEQLQRELSRLRSKKQGPGEPLADALSRGDFRGAARQLQQLRRELDAKQLDAAAKRELAEQLDQLQKQLEQLSDAGRETERELAQRQFDARESPASGGDTDRGEQKPGSESQRQAGESSNSGAQQQADAAARAEALSQIAAQNGRLEELQQAMADASHGVQAGNEEQAKQGLGDLQKQLEQLAKQTDESRLLTESMQDCANCKSGIASGRKPEADQPGAGSGSRPGPGLSQRPGGQSGGGEQGQDAASREAGKEPGGHAPGTGIGPGLAKDGQADANFPGGFDTRVRGQIGAGPMRAAGPAAGPNAKGSALQTIRKQAEELSRNGEAQKLENQPLDRSRREQKKQYFDSLRQSP